MARTLEELVAERPPDREQIEALKKEMIARVRGYRLRDLRETYGLTQLEQAESLHMSLGTISRIEHGDIEQMRVETLRRYVESLGGKLHIEVELGDTRHTIA
jgi:predicted transcriptional regulator